MSNAHKPKYLKPSPPTTQEMEDAEVFSIVKSNPGRKVDANALTPIALGNDGKLFFTDPPPSKSEMVMAVLGLVGLAFGVLLGVISVVLVLVVPATDPRILSFCVMGVIALVAIINLKGEKKNVQQ